MLNIERDPLQDHAINQIDFSLSGFDFSSCVSCFGVCLILNHALHFVMSKLYKSTMINLHSQ